MIAVALDASSLIRHLNGRSGADTDAVKAALDAGTAVLPPLGRHRGAVAAWRIRRSDATSEHRPPTRRPAGVLGARRPLAGRGRRRRSAGTNRGRAHRPVVHRPQRASHLGGHRLPLLSSRTDSSCSPERPRMAKRKPEPSLFDTPDDTPAGPAAAPRGRRGGSAASGRRQRRGGAARRRAEPLPELRALGDHLARAARRARRPQAGAAPHPVHDVAAEPHRRRQAPQVRQGGRRRDGRLPPARRLGPLRDAGPHGPAVLAALSAGRRLGQLRLARRRSGGGDALHRVPAGPHLGRDPPGDRPGDGPVPAQLRRHQDRTGGAAVAHPQPARQRRHRHRGGDGHQHPAAQPHRGVPGARSSCSTTRICRWRSCAAG